MSGPVVVLGLDGAGWPVLRPLLDAGRMPFVARLIADGAWGELTSPWPGSTFPSWTSIVTGVSPGTHGMVDFTVFDPATHAVRFIDSSQRKAPAVWEVAHRAGRTCAVLGVPGTFPPDRAVDLMVAGFDTPVTTSTEPSFVYPPSWRKRLNASGGFPLTPVQELRIGPGWHHKAWAALKDSIEGKTRIAELVLRELRPDFFMMVFGESDTVCHHFWPWADPASPRGRILADDTLADAIADIYSRLDSALERIVAAAGDVRLLMVVSDHGFGGAGTTALYLNRFLARHGFLSFARGSFIRLPSPLPVASLLPRRAQQWLFRRGKFLVGAMESRRRLGGIDWAGTTAFSEELPYAPAVRLNLRGRERYGTVDHSGRDQALDEVGRALEGWRDADTGMPVVEKVARRERVFQGPALAAMPDLLLDLAIPGGYSYVLASSGGRPGPVQREMNPRSLGAKGAGMHGTHRRDGILVAVGQGVIPGRMEGSVPSEGVAASMLAALSVAAPGSMHPPPAGLPCASREGEEAGPSPRIDGEDASWEWERVRRLKGLGYLG